MLLLYEIKKLLTTPAILGFCVLSFIFNTIIILAHDNLAADNIPKPVIENTFAEYQAADQAEAFIFKNHITGKNADNVRALYAKLQPVVDAKAERGEAFSPYFGIYTPYTHSLLFGTVLPAVIAEGCILAMLLSLLNVGYENIRNTEYIVYSSKTGRKIIREKLAASLISVFALFLGLLLLTLSLFFARFDFSAVWNDYVSSAYNNAVQAYSRPFISWGSYTVAQYLTVFIGAAFTLVVCFTIMGFALGCFIRNLYGSCMAAVSICGLMFFTELLLPIGSTLRGLLNMSPVGLWLNAGHWFTDGEADIIHAHFETIGLAGSLIIFSMLCIIGATRFRRRELL